MSNDSHRGWEDDGEITSYRNADLINRKSEGQIGYLHQARAGNTHRLECWPKVEWSELALYFMGVKAGEEVGKLKWETCWIFMLFKIKLSGQFRIYVLVLVDAFL